MTEIREKIAEENPYPKDEDTAFLTEVGLHDAYMAGVDATLAAPQIKEGQELREKAKSGKLVELEDDQSTRFLDEHSTGRVGSMTWEREFAARRARDGMKDAGFRRVQEKG